MLLLLLSLGVWAEEVHGLVYSTQSSATSLHGQVYVPGARVTLDGQEATSDDLGVFRFKKVTAGKHVLEVTKDGFVAARQEIEVTGGPLPFQVKVALSPTGGTVSAGSVYISCRSRPQMINQTTQWFRGRIINGQDPLSVGANPPLDPEAPHQWGDNPTTFDENVVMMLPETPAATRLHKVADAPTWIAFGGGKLYTSYNGRLEVTDPATHEALASLPNEGTVGLTPCGPWMLANQMSAHPGVMLVNTTTHVVDRFVPTPGLPSGAWLEGDRLYVSLFDTGTGRLVCLSAASGTVLGEVTVGSGPLQLAAAGPYLLVVNSFAASVSVVDRAALKVVAVIGVGVQPQRLAVRPDGLQAMVTNRQSDTVSVLDLKGLRAVRTTRVGAIPVDVAYSPDGKRAWVACTGDGTVRVLDGVSGAQLHATTPLPQACPFGVAVKP